jgi:hypothetical protein
MLPGVLDAVGQVRISTTLLVLSLPWLALAVAGWLNDRVTSRMTMLLIASNALLNVTLYRDRNHVIALCAFGVAAGAGLAASDRRLRSSPVLRASVAAILIGFLAAETVRTRRVVTSVVNSTLTQDPCEGLLDFRHLEPEYVRRVKIKYGMSNPDCGVGR